MQETQFITTEPILQRWTKPGIVTSLIDTDKVHVHAKLLQSWSTLCNSMDYSPPGSSVHCISQARIMEWVAISFSRRSSRCRDWTRISYVSCIGGFFTTWATWEAPTVKVAKQIKALYNYGTRCHVRPQKSKMCLGGIREGIPEEVKNKGLQSKRSNRSWAQFSN